MKLKTFEKVNNTMEPEYKVYTKDKEYLYTLLVDYTKPTDNGIRELLILEEEGAEVLHVRVNKEQILSVMVTVD